MVSNQSCEKTEVLQDPNGGLKELSADYDNANSILGPDVTLNGTMLKFRDEAAFEATIQSMKDWGTEEFREWELNFPFTSLRASDAIQDQVNSDLLQPVLNGLPNVGVELEDDLIKTLLNPRKQLQIGRLVFTLNTSTEEVTVTSSVPNGRLQVVDIDNNTTSLQDKLVFSFEDNILDQVEEEPETGSTPVAIGPVRVIICCLGGGGGGVSSCERAPRKKDDKIIQVTHNRRLDCKLVYQPAGIYFSIVGKAKSQQGSGLFTGIARGARVETRMSYEYTVYCDGDFVKESATDVNKNGRDGNTSRIRPYQATRALQSFDVACVFIYENSVATRSFNIKSN